MSILAGAGWLMLGVSLTGLMLGYLTGVSETPIAGAVISRGFGAAAGLVAAFVSRSPGQATTGQQSAGSAPAAADSPQVLAILGGVLTAFAPAFILSTFIGHPARSFSRLGATGSALGRPRPAPSDICPGRLALDHVLAGRGSPRPTG
jgi:hypothetical protein